MMKKFILPIIIIVIDPELLFKTTQGKFENEWISRKIILKWGAEVQFQKAVVSWWIYDSQFSSQILFL